MRTQSCSKPQRRFAERSAIQVSAKSNSLGVEFGSADTLFSSPMIVRPALMWADLVVPQIRKCAMYRQDPRNLQVLQLQRSLGTHR